MLAGQQGLVGAGASSDPSGRGEGHPGTVGGGALQNGEEPLALREVCSQLGSIRGSLPRGQRDPALCVVFVAFRSHHPETTVHSQMSSPRQALWPQLQPGRQGSLQGHWCCVAFCTCGRLMCPLGAVWTGQGLPARASLSPENVTVTNAVGLLIVRCVLCGKSCEVAQVCLKPI